MFEYEIRHCEAQTYVLTMLVKWCKQKILLLYVNIKTFEIFPFSLNLLVVKMLLL